ncbi:hypothetical protein GMRT_13612 [Giardia muris]|uniref:Uncharacterized protein n=1 Tax=Giardia muris TaxID=5742 RepID=A0A4Z1SW06_GIAMU|nr:hypothetical protein GMRT_13612 [Giardia muris]|eukprot:TNJ30032.1 hypothetical protein GMRT_13612 [Giardia muris]
MQSRIAHHGLGRRPASREPAGFVANYQAHVDRVLESIGINPRFILGCDEFFTVLVCLFATITLLFFIVAPFTFVEPSKRLLVTPWESQESFLHLASADLLKHGYEYTQMNSVTIVNRQDDYQGIIVRKPLLSQGQFSPVYSHIFNETVHVYTPSQGPITTILHVPTNSDASSIEALRVVLTATFRALQDNPHVALIAGSSYDATSRVANSLHNIDAPIHVHFKPGTGWRGLQVIDPIDLVGKCKTCVRPVLLPQYKLLLDMAGAIGRISRYTLLNRGAILLTTTSGLYGAEIAPSKLDSIGLEAHLLDEALIGSAAAKLYPQISRFLETLSKKSVESYIPMAMVLGSISVPRIFLLTLVVASLLATPYIIIQKKGKHEFFRTFCFGIFSRCFMVSIGLALFLGYYLLFVRTDAILSIGLGMHQSFIHGLVLLGLGISMFCWGIVPPSDLVSIFREGITVNLLASLLGLFIPEMYGFSTLSFQVAFLQLVSFGSMRYLARRFKLHSLKVKSGICFSFLLLAYPLAYYQFYLLINGISHVQVTIPGLSRLDGLARIAILAFQILICLAVLFGHLVAFTRMLPSRFLLGLGCIFVSIAFMYYSTTRTASTQTIANWKHTPGVLGTPSTQGSIDLTFWCFDDQHLCGLDTSLAGFVDHAIIQNADVDLMAGDDTEEERHKDVFTLSAFHDAVNLTIPKLMTHSIRCDDQKCHSVDGEHKDFIVVADSHLLDERNVYHTTTGELAEITGEPMYICERVPVTFEENIYWRRTYQAYSCYHPE